MRLELPPLFRVPANKPVEMYCEFALPRQSADIEVQWSCDGLPPESDWQKPNPEGLLKCRHTIEVVQVTHEGTYRCIVQPTGSPELSTSTLLFVVSAAATQPAGGSHTDTDPSNKRHSSTTKGDSPASKTQSTASGDGSRLRRSQRIKDQHSAHDSVDAESSDEPLTCPPTTTQSLLQFARPLGVNCTQETMSDSGAADPFECAADTVLQSRCVSHVDQRKNWFGFARGAFNDLPQKLRRKRASLSIEDFQVLIALAGPFQLIFLQLMPFNNPEYNSVYSLLVCCIRKINI